MIAKSLKHLLIVLLAAIVSFAIANAAQAPQEGGTLPDFELKVPDNAQERDYLGLAGKSRFTISQIKRMLSSSKFSACTAPTASGKHPQ